MYIYRVEHSIINYDEKVFAGPYMSDLHETSAWCDGPFYHSDNEHPEPWDDPEILPQILGKQTNQYYSGFSNLSQLRKWFKEKELKKLKVLGYKVYKYKAKERIKGKTQCLFIPKEDQERLEVRISIKSSK